MVDIHRSTHDETHAGSKASGNLMEHRPDSLDLLEGMGSPGGSQGGADYPPAGGPTATGFPPHGKVVPIADLSGL